MINCKFCEIIEGKVEDYKLWENERFLLFLDINPIKPGHSMLIPKKHVDYFFNLDDELYLELFKIAKKLSEPLKIATNAERIGMGVVGFDIPHAHLHLIPLHKPNELLNSKLSKKANPEELKEIQIKIKKLLLI
ncbi:MAG: HIT family protein [Nanoarchaeota archaeon]